VRIFKNRAFSKWAAREGLKDKALLVAVDELRALKHLANELLGYSDKLLKQAMEYGELIEIESNE
jgi:hypothetical protein